MRQLKSLSCLFLSVFFMLTACKKEDNLMTMQDMHKFIGSYQGVASHWHTQSAETRGYHDEVVVQVNKGNGASLTLNISYNQSNLMVINDVVLDSDGNFFYERGNGAMSTGSGLSFKDNVLSFHDVSKCGMACSEGVYFNATKIRYIR